MTNIESSNIIPDVSTRLFHEFKMGNERAFEELFHRTFHRLFAFAVKITKDETMAEDILQNVYIKLWEKKRQVKSINIEAYLFKLVRNDCIDYIKLVKIAEKKEIDLDHVSQYEELYRIDFVRDEPCQLIREELKEAIEQTVGSLPERCREVFILSKFEGLKNREIANKLQINIKNVERHLTRAAKTFRQRFSNNTGYYT